MATTKKKPTTKTAAKKTTATRKPTTALTTKKAVTKKQNTTTEQSFRPVAESVPFMTFKFTRQSLYWLILSVLVLALGTWVMYLNVRIQRLYDQVEINTQLNQDYIVPAIQQHHPDAGQPKVQP